MYLVEVIERFKDRQKKRVVNVRRTHSNGDNAFDAENPMEKFFLAMDDYLTFQK